MDRELDQQSQEGDGAGSYNLRQLLRTADLRPPLFVACTLQVMQQLSGVNAVRITHQHYVLILHLCFMLMFSIF